jgi:hypothetical protein
MPPIWKRDEGDEEKEVGTGRGEASHARMTFVLFF